MLDTDELNRRHQPLTTDAMSLPPVIAINVIQFTNTLLPIRCETDEQLISSNQSFPLHYEFILLTMELMIRSEMIYASFISNILYHIYYMQAH